MMPRRWVWGTASAMLLLAGASVMLPHGNLHGSGNVPAFLFGAAIMLGGFFLALWRKDVPWLLIGVVAVAARVVLLGQVPSGDVYRYIWEGKLLLHQINPYLHAPEAVELAGLRDAVWESVWHKTYSAIYPPLAEWVFAAMALVSPTVLFFKAAFAAADLLAGTLLGRRYGAAAALLYLWNPLVIYSFAGGGHYDSLFLLALVLGWLAWDKGARTQSLLWIGAAVAFKWMALPILAWAVWRVFRESGWKAALAGAASGAAPLLTSWTCVGLWTGEWTWRLYPDGFAQYARSAEFIPRIIGSLWEGSFHNAWFVPPLALAWCAVILKARKFVTAAEGALFFALIFSPLVHAWYFTWLMPFAVASRNRGSLLVSASGFVYFVVYHRMAAEGWVFRPWEIAGLWLPFVLGFLWTYLRPRRDDPVPCDA